MEKKYDYIDEEYRVAIQKAMNRAEQTFYRTLQKHGYSDYTAFELKVHIISTDYDGILTTLSVSNLPNLLSGKKE